jgi:DNA-directed RNA polymerase specialized sigma24 family protein
MGVRIRPKYAEGLSYQQIADVTGLSVSLVGVRIHRMKQAFTDRYVEQ